MTDTRRPHFLSHVTPVPRVTHPGTVRAWAAAPLEPAMPAPSAPLPPPPAIAEQPSPPRSVAFEPLAAAPMPMPPPSAPVVIDHTPRMAAGIDTLRQEARRLGEQARSDALEIGVLIARRILERELSTSLDPLFGLIRSAIRRVGEARQITVKVCIDDHRRLADAPGSDLSLANVRVVPDPNLSAGDVVVESDQHGVDARLDTRLDELRRELREAMTQE